MENVRYKVLHSASTTRRKDLMLQPDEVAAILRLKKLGWGSKTIARELGISKNTVKSYLKKKGWVSYQTPKRAKVLDGLEDWLEEAFRQHLGNADVVRQELLSQHKIDVSLRTVERAVKPFRQQLQAAAKATLRFETPAGKQLQIDFGTTTVGIADEKVRVHLFVATLGFSRRPFVAAFRHERQSAWLRGLEGAFAHFGGVTEQVLVDNAKALVRHHNAKTREVEFNDRFHAFSTYWGFTPKACAPYRARTKGKDESGVKYVKRNAVAGRHFDSWAQLEAHLYWWMRKVADIRIHGTTGERPIDRFKREEAQVLKPLEGRPPFRQVRELSRRVNSEACVEVDTNCYSVPWHLIGNQVTVQVADSQVIVIFGQDTVACHAQNQGQRQRIIDRKHLEGIVGATQPHLSPDSLPEIPPPEPDGELLRPLSDYEAIAGGAW
ncbi:IS21 family transposase [Desulfoluna spongiiphila]|nr:IS21 family transposase [Desulfoluna spongiiphila]VVS94890.1 integrase catalytic core [Desulfoluna spongiiphila]